MNKVFDVRSILDELVPVSILSQYAKGIAASRDSGGIFWQTLFAKADLRHENWLKVVLECGRGRSANKMNNQWSRGKCAGIPTENGGTA